MFEKGKRRSSSGSRFALIRRGLGFLAALTMISSAHSMDLIQAFERALAKDPHYQQTRADLEATRETRPQAIANLLPQLSALGASDWNYLNNTKQTFQGAGSQRYWRQSIGVRLDQSLFDWGRWVQLFQTDNQIAQAEAAYASAWQDLAVRTSLAYFNVLLAQDTLEFSRAEENSLARQLEQAQQRFEVGLIAITDVLEAQAGYDGAKSRTIFAANQIDNAKEALRVIIGDFGSELAVLGPDLPLIPPEPADLEEWNRVAQTRNLDIMVAKNQTEFAQKNIALQRSGHFPTVDIVGNYEIIDNSSSFGQRGDDGRIGLVLNVPIFSGGAVDSRTRQARFQFESAQDQLVSTQRAITRQVKDAYRGVLSTISQVQALSATVKSARSALEATEAGFEVGTRTMVDVVTVQGGLFRAQRDHSQARYDYILDWLRLKQAASMLTGGDLQVINAQLQEEP